MDFFLSVMGMVMVVEGLPYFAFPEKMKSWVKKIEALNDKSLRKLGLTLMVLGVFFVYLGTGG
ncbi:MAG: DUF2065 domain-containing protein [Deltaproteobacteria bacterium]|nr:DUF2065 domain-containing protein [Deltaproteobacteria bacterium]MBW1954148.1 DUF2065 domain-containing protein [Deltaproteobacteria bacterium]MBW2041038.1 DUF2065 domain-containing protein [Deltaproteobacteria bacterium]MBW2131343.1 DUF2065 domain-containing protein [Deltaproteobacteria bacterium]